MGDTDTAGDVGPAVPKVVLIGYWRSDSEPHWPDPRAFEDSSWDASERDLVASYLASAPTIANTYRGLSPCRLCGLPNGHQEFTDGFYLWPQGLSHYVGDHSVRLPRRVIDHIRQHVGDFELYDWRSLRPEWRPRELEKPWWVPGVFKGSWPGWRRRFADWRLQRFMRRRERHQDRERRAAGQRRIPRIERPPGPAESTWWQSARPNF